MILRKAKHSEQTNIWNILQDAIDQRKKDGSEQWQHGYPNEQTVYDDINNSYGYVLLPIMLLLHTPQLFLARNLLIMTLTGVG